MRSTTHVRIDDSERKTPQKLSRFCPNSAHGSLSAVNHGPAHIADRSPESPLLKALSVRTGGNQGLSARIFFSSRQKKKSTPKACSFSFHARRSVSSEKYRQILPGRTFPPFPPAGSPLEENYFLTASSTLEDLNMAPTVQPRSRRRRFTPSRVTVALISIPLGV